MLVLDRSPKPSDKHVAHPLAFTIHAAIRIARGFVYLTAVVDVFSRVLAHRTAITLEACHAVEALEEAYARFGKREIINTDQGSQFTAQVFVDAVLGRGAKLSMDGQGGGAITFLSNGFGVP
jgi:transposase InsO family protein